MNVHFPIFETSDPDFYCSYYATLYQSKLCHLDLCLTISALRFKIP